MKNCPRCGSARVSQVSSATWRCAGCGKTSRVQRRKCDNLDRLRKEALEALQQASVARNQAAALAEVLRLVRPALDKARLVELPGRFGDLAATLPMAAGELVDAALNQADATGCENWRPTIADLLAAICAFEQRVEADPVQILLFGDGSGDVMAPPDADDKDLFESVFAFDNLEQLWDYLLAGKLPEAAEARA